MRLFPLAVIHKCASDRWNGILLMELIDFAEKEKEKIHTLIPCSPKALAFVQANRDSLELNYIIKTQDRILTEDSK